MAENHWTIDEAVLWWLRREGRVTPRRHLAALTGHEPNKVTQALRRLEAKGLVHAGGNNDWSPK